MMNKSIKCGMKSFAIASVCLIMTMSNASAAMISTAQVKEQVQNSISRDQVLVALQRADVQNVLARNGVDFGDAQARINALTDAEIASLHSDIESMPAGAGAGGVLVTVVLVFVILDIAGVTNVFSFIRPAR